MQIHIGGLPIQYRYAAGEGTPVLLLHGWGCSGETMACMFDFLCSKGIAVLAPDLPGFGQSPEPPETFTVYDYADTVAALLDALGLSRVILAGHSFGGRLGIILAALSDRIEKLILIDSAGLKPRRGIRYYIKVLTYKLKKRLRLNTTGSGSTDYQALSPAMRRVFVAVVNEHLDALTKKITCPTLIVWGALDRDTPLAMGKKLEKRIPDSGLIILENSGHYSFLDQYTDFMLIAYAFIKEAAL